MERMNHGRSLGRPTLIEREGPCAHAGDAQANRIPRVEEIACHRLARRTKGLHFPHPE